MTEKIQIFGLKEIDKPILFTPWSALHFAVGMFMQQQGFSFWESFILHAIYETSDIIKNINDIEYNSIPNSVADQTIVMLGHYAAKHLNNNTLPYIYLVGPIFAGLTFNLSELG